MFRSTKPSHRDIAHWSRATEWPSSLPGCRPHVSLPTFLLFCGFQFLCDVSLLSGKVASVKIKAAPAPSITPRARSTLLGGAGQGVAFSSASLLWTAAALVDVAFGCEVACTPAIKDFCLPKGLQVTASLHPPWPSPAWSPWHTRLLLLLCLPHVALPSSHPPFSSINIQTVSISPPGPFLMKSHEEPFAALTLLALVLHRIHRLPLESLLAHLPCW